MKTCKINGIEFYLGNRASGKTYSVFKKAIKDYNETGKPSFVVYRERHNSHSPSIAEVQYIEGLMIEWVTIHVSDEKIRTEYKNPYITTIKIGDNVVFEVGKIEELKGREKEFSNVIFDSLYHNDIFDGLTEKVTECAINAGILEEKELNVLVTTQYATIEDFKEYLSDRGITPLQTEKYKLKGEHNESNNAK